MYWLGSKVSNFFHVYIDIIVSEKRDIARDLLILTESAIQNSLEHQSLFSNQNCLLLDQK